MKILNLEDEEIYLYYNNVNVIGNSIFIECVNGDHVQQSECIAELTNPVHAENLKRILSLSVKIHTLKYVELSEENEKLYQVYDYDGFDPIGNLITLEDEFLKDIRYNIN